MDTKQLENKLIGFFQRCQDRGYPLENSRLREVETDYVLEVKANWIDKMNSYSKALDILIGFLWETTDAETRKKIFAISILDSEEHSQILTEITQDKKI